MMTSGHKGGTGLSEEGREEDEEGEEEEDVDGELVEHAHEPFGKNSSSCSKIWLKLSSLHLVVVQCFFP